MFKKKPVLPSFEEVHTYVKDLEHITNLRSRAEGEEEMKRYSNIVDCMQRVLIQIHPHEEDPENTL